MTNLREPLSELPEDYTPATVPNADAQQRVGDPHRQPLGRARPRQNPNQLTFSWGSPATPSPAPPTEPPPESASAVQAPVAPAPVKAPMLPIDIRRMKVGLSPSLGTASPALLAGRKTLREVVERYLREAGMPYIAVDEAKKALFAGAKLRSFHFVVYRPTGKNWLLWAARYMNKEVRQDLAQWQDVFGEGFVAAVAKQAKDGSLKFQLLTGESVEIK